MSQDFLLHLVWPLVFVGQSVLVSGRICPPTWLAEWPQNNGNNG